MRTSTSTFSHGIFSGKKNLKKNQQKKQKKKKKKKNGKLTNKIFPVWCNVKGERNLKAYYTSK